MVIRPMIIGQSPSPPTIAGEPETIGQPAAEPSEVPRVAEEFGGRKGLDPTRYGDWEKNGRCIDF